MVYPWLVASAHLPRLKLPISTHGSNFLLQKEIPVVPKRISTFGYAPHNEWFIVTSNVSHPFTRYSESERYFRGHQRTPGQGTARANESVGTRSKLVRYVPDSPAYAIHRSTVGSGDLRRVSLPERQ